jgi:glycosyltransferase involved in cell wall biosynthesis
MNGLIIDARFLFSSGIGVYLRALLPAVLSHFHDKKVTVYCQSQDLPWLQKFQKSGVAVIAMHAANYSLKEQFFWLFKIFKHRNRVFWSPQYNFPLIHLGPRVVTVHDIGHLVLPEYKSSFLKTLYARTFFSLLGSCADKILCVSEFTKNQLVEIARISSEKIEVIHSALDKTRLDVATVPALPLPKAYALFVGNIKTHKNLKNLLLAMAEVQKHQDLSLVIVGKKEGFITPGEEVFRLADQIDVRYLFSGEIKDSELAFIYKSARLLVFPSLLEGFGLPPLEAMYFECPIAASKAASIPEVCGSAALYFDPLSPQEMSSVILKVASDENLRSRLIAEGKERLTHFDLAKFQIKTIQALEACFIRR